MDIAHRVFAPADRAVRWLFEQIGAGMLRRDGKVMVEQIEAALANGTLFGGAALEPHVIEFSGGDAWFLTHPASGCGDGRGCRVRDLIDGQVPAGLPDGRYEARVNDRGDRLLIAYGLND